MTRALLLLLPLSLTACQTTRTVTLVGLSDYHAHAVPFTAEGEANRGGVARAIAYLKEAKGRGDTLVLSGGDTLNKGVPTWSDEYPCVEWPWFNGWVDAMALGNHDLDYGTEAFERCRASITYPVLSANLVKEDGEPYFQVEGHPWLVREVGGVRLGLFAVGGPDMAKLVKAENLPAGTHWEDGRAVARRIVTELREREKVDAVVLFGHQSREDDEALAREVPGIDIILGTHSHYRGELRLIEGTRTYYVSPYQYLAYLSEVRLQFKGKKLEQVTGGLVKLDASRPEDPEVAARVAELQQRLKEKRPERFEVLGRLPRALPDEGISTGEAPIGRWATEVLRQASGAHAFFATSSTFRGGLPAGAVTVEDFYAAIPYRNVLALAEMTGAQLQEWLVLVESRRGADGFSQFSGVRYTARDGKPAEVEILKDPAHPEAGYTRLDPSATYRLGTLEFQAYTAQGYRELFGKASNPRRTSLDMHTLLIEALKAGSAEPLPAH
ncbi:bifunctional metallophosphatase/5'-nucleotidase [Hyalangium versicolor]|uniref:bifunctional metallophosphatase/5'-nucleotidase n=1 Tax=Hyalangium versicolor TaxID=2861190 RepID=UPI001CCAFF4B|nr:5'-nucleotidase C-terminal domain-containing protein [Hyalangium versicolor]